MRSRSGWSKQNSSVVARSSENLAMGMPCGEEFAPLMKTHCLSRARYKAVWYVRFISWASSMKTMSLSLAVKKQAIEVGHVVERLAEDFVEIGRHLLGDHGCQGTLAKPRRPDQHGMVEPLAVLLAGIQRHLDLADHVPLPDQMGQGGWLGNR